MTRKLRILQVLLIVQSFFLTPAAVSQTYMSEMFSDETDARNCDGTAVAGIACYGPYCDDMKLVCDTRQPTVDMSSAQWSGAISEEPMINDFHCPPSRPVIAAMRCRNGSCDDLNVMCASTTAELTNTCAWNGTWISEEAGRNELRFSGKVASGVKCQGGYCDDKQLYLCDVKTYSSPTSAIITGEWVKINECAGERCNSSTHSFDVGVANEESTATVETSGESISVMVGAEVKASTGMLPGGEVTGKFEVTGEMSQERSKEIASSFSRTQNSTTSVTCDGEHSFWQWQSRLKYQYPDRSMTVPITARSMIVVCAGPKESPPDITDISWVPGSDDDADKEVQLEWTVCAGENQTCAFTGTKNIRFGANGKYATKVMSGPVQCTNAVFGDPAPNVAKSCEIGEPKINWKACAFEGGSCSFSGSKWVRYGANGKYSQKLLSGPVQCTNGVFGDPAPGVAKACDVQN